MAVVVFPKAKGRLTLIILYFLLSYFSEISLKVIFFLQDPAQFSTACSALLAFHQTSVGAGQGEHLVFLGDGREGEVEDNMNMAVSR